MNWKIVVAFLVGALVAWLIAVWGMRKGKKYDEVYDRVIEDTTDESVKIRTLTDQHALDQKAHEEFLVLLREEHEVDLLREKVRFDDAVRAHRNEVAELQSSASIGDSVRMQIDTTKLQMQQQKDEFARLELDWKKRLEAVESKHAALDADWKARLGALEDELVAARRECACDRTPVAQER